MDYMYSYFDSIQVIDANLTKAKAYTYIENAIIDYINNSDFDNKTFLINTIATDSFYYKPLFNQELNMSDNMNNSEFSADQQMYIEELEGIVNSSSYNYTTVKNSILTLDSDASSNLSTSDYKYIVCGTNSVAYFANDYYYNKYTTWETMLGQYNKTLMGPNYGDLIDADGEGALHGGAAALITGQLYAVPEAMVVGAAIGSTSNFIGQLGGAFGWW